MSIRNLLNLAVLFTILSSFLSAQPETNLAYEKKVITSLESDWLEAIKEKSVDKCLSFFAEDGEWIPANSPSVKGYEKIRERIENTFNDPSFDWSVYSVKLAGIEISSSGDLAVVHHYALEPNKTRWVNVWKKINEEWKCILTMDNDI